MPETMPVPKVSIVGDEAKDGRGRDGEGPVLEGVVARLARRRALVRLHKVQHVHDDAADGEVDYLHHRVVRRVPVEEQVHVARHENHEVELLRLAR